jgi:hypothetical protein
MYLAQFTLAFRPADHYAESQAEAGNQHIINYCAFGFQIVVRQCPAAEGFTTGTAGHRVCPLPAPAPVVNGPTRLVQWQRRMAAGAARRCVCVPVTVGAGWARPAGVLLPWRGSEAPTRRRAGPRRARPLAGHCHRHVASD